MYTVLYKLLNSYFITFILNFQLSTFNFILLSIILVQFDFLQTDPQVV